MEAFKLANANASVIAVTTSAASLLALIDTAGATTHDFRPHMNAVDMFVEDGDIRVLYDTNTPTAAKGILLKRGGHYRFRRIAVSQMKLISATGSSVSASVQIGTSEVHEPSSADFAPYALEQGAGEDINANVQVTEIRNSFAYISTATTTQVKTGAGVLHSITVLGGTAGTITVYDETSGTTVIIAAFDSTNALMTYIFDEAFSTGLKIITAAATKINVSYR